MQLAVMSVPKMIILLAIKNQIMKIKVIKTSKYHKSLIIVVVEKTEPEILTEVIILMVNKCDAVVIVKTVDPEKIMILEVSIFDF